MKLNVTRKDGILIITPQVKRIDASIATDFKSKLIEFLDNGCTDTQFLGDNGISIIYTTGVVDNSDLVPLRENIYILP